MNPIKLLFKLLKRFVWQDDEQYAVTLEKAQAWWDAIRFDKERMAELTGKDLMLAKFKAWSCEWYGSVVFAIIYMWAIKAVHQWITDEGKDDDENEVD